MAGDMSGMLDDVTSSLYPAAASPQSIEWFLTQYSHLPAPNAPLIITEGGYDTMPGTDTDGSQGVDVTVQAKYTLDLFADTYSWGIAHTYTYELLDEIADPSFKDHEQHFGVYYNDGTPKPAAIALHNMNMILADGSSEATSFATTPLNFSVDGLSNAMGGRSLVLERADGTYDLLLWAEPNLWDATKLQEITPPVTPVTVNFNGPYTTLDVYDPMVGTSPVSQSTDSSTLSLLVVDHPMIVHIGLPSPKACGPYPSGSIYSLQVSQTPGTTTPSITQCPYGGNQPTQTVVTQTYACTNGVQTAQGTPASTTTFVGNASCTSPLACLDSKGQSHASGSTYVLQLGQMAGTTTPSVAQCPYGGTQPTQTTLTQNYACTNGVQTAQGSSSSVTASLGNPTCKASTASTCDGHKSGSSFSITAVISGTRPASTVECANGGTVARRTTTTTGYYYDNGVIVTGPSKTSTNDNGKPVCSATPTVTSCGTHKPGSSYSATTVLLSSRPATTLECANGGVMPTRTATTTGYYCNHGTQITGTSGSSTADNGKPKCTKP